MKRNQKPKKRHRKNFDPTKIEIPEHRPEVEILADLEDVCCSPGFAHTLGFLCWRENFFGFQDQLVPEDLSRFSSEERLSRSELSLLTRLMVSAPLNLTLPAPEKTQKQIEDIEALLLELHHTLNIPFFDHMKTSLTEGPHSEPTEQFAKTLREPIFYSAEAAYHFQYRDFAVIRYDADKEWLLANKGYLPEDVPVFYSTVSELQTKEIERLHSMFTPENIDELSLLSVFRFTAEQIAKESGLSVEKVQGVIDAFSVDEIPLLPEYREIGSWNQASTFPIIPLEKGAFLLFQPYCLVESSYETPFFWMQQDRQYVNTAAVHRGSFTEHFSAGRLASVFGAENVHRNVTIYNSRSETVGEIDVLVTYSDRAIVLQAKSKKLTEASRKGSQEAVKSDLKKAVQDAYDQGYSCAERLFVDGFEFKDCSGKTIDVSGDLNEVFLLCVVADYFPGLPNYADKYVTLHQHDVINHPYIIDVFYLDVLCELLDRPLHLLSFLNRRSQYSDRVHSSSELAVLGFHLSQNLWFNDEVDHIQLGQEFSAPIDVAMLARRDGIPGDTVPDGILTKHRDTHFGFLIDQVGEMTQGRVLELGFLLLEGSTNTAEQVSDAIDIIFDRANETGGVHDFSIGLGSSGLTVHCGNENDDDTRKRLQTHCEIAKYRAKSSSWFGLALSSTKRGAIRVALGLHSEWKHDAGMENAVRIFGSKPTKNLRNANWNQRRRTKIGANEPCPCGSGKKFKKCCRRKNIF